MTDSLMSIWAQCQPVRVTPEPTDVRARGHRCRLIGGEWCMLNPQAGDWYRCNPDHAAECERARVPHGVEVRDG